MRKITYKTASIIQLVFVIIIIIIMANPALAITELEYYNEQALLAAGNNCLFELNKEIADQEELSRLAFLLLDLRDKAGISPNVSLQAMTAGSENLMHKYSCEQILNLYKNLFQKYGFTGMIKN